MSIWPGAVASNDDLFIAVNSLDTTLVTGIDASITTVVLASTTNFPPIGGIIIDNEVIFYTSVSGNTLLGCIRGSDGTTAAAHAATAPVANGVIAFHHNGVKDEIISIETYLNLVLGGDTAVVAAEFETLIGITSNIQDQLDAKAPSFTPGDISTTTDGVTINFGDNATVGPNTIVDIDTADATHTGLLTDTDWSTFNGKQDALGYTPVPNTRTVNGHPLSADVTVTKSDVGLGNVDNTSDANKPVSTATQTALNLKKNIATGNAYKFETTDTSGNLQETTVTASRAVATDANGLPVASATTATELGYVNGVTSTIQTQFTGKASTALSNLTSVAINTALLPLSDNTIDLGSATNEFRSAYLKTSLIFQETGAGTDTITLQAPSSIATGYTLTLPIDDGNSNQVLTTDGNGVLSWTTPAGTGATTALDNLAAVAINTSLLPASDNAIDLGSTTKDWRSIYLSTSLKNGSTTLATATELGYLTGVTSAIQTQLNAKAPLASPTFTGTVTMPTPFTLGATSVTATGTELNYSVGVTSAIQTQLNGKLSLTGGTLAGVVLVPSSDLHLQEASGTDVITLAVASLATSRTYTIPDAGTNASFLMTAGAQTIGDDKTINGAWTWNTGFIYANLGTPSFPGLALNGVAKTTGFSGGSGGENITLSAAGVQAMEWSNVSGVKTITIASTFPLTIGSTTSFSGLTASTVPYLDSSKVLTSSSVTPTELGYLSGVTSAIQTQLDTKATDSLVVHLAGTESITGAKTFAADLNVERSNSGDNVWAFVSNTSNTANSYASLKLAVAGTTAADPYIYFNIPSGSQWTIGSDNSDSDKFKISQSTGLGTNDALIISASTLAVAIHGSTTNDAATAGYVGEYISSNVNSNTALPTSGQFGDLTSITLSAGDWIVSCVVRFNSLTSTTFTGAEVGMSTTSGNSNTGLTATDNYVPLTFPAAVHGTNDAFVSISIPMYRFSFSTSTTVYLKYTGTYTGTAPGANGSIKALRTR